MKWTSISLDATDLEQTGHLNPKRKQQKTEPSIFTAVCLMQPPKLLRTESLTTLSVEWNVSGGMSLEVSTKIKRWPAENVERLSSSAWSRTRPLPWRDPSCCDSSWVLESIFNNLVNRLQLLTSWYSAFKKGHEWGVSPNKGTYCVCSLS